MSKTGINGASAEQLSLRIDQLRAAGANDSTIQEAVLRDMKNKDLGALLGRPDHEDVAPNYGDTAPTR